MKNLTVLLVAMSVVLVGCVFVMFSGLFSGAATPLAFLVASVCVLGLIFFSGERHR